jgi:hypothetical protein
MVYLRQIFSNATRRTRSKKRSNAPSGSAGFACESVCWRKPTQCERFALQIETSFQQFRHLVDACPLVQFSSMTYDKRGTHEGYIRGELYRCIPRDHILSASLSQNI